MRHLSETEKATYERDGVVLVKASIDQAQVGEVLQVLENYLTEHPADVRGGLDRRLFPHDVGFRRLLNRLPLARLAAEATDSKQVRIYFEQIFIKDANTPAVFPWHQDAPYWPIAGTQIASTWLALSRSTVEGSALEFVRGSHRWGKTYRPVAGDNTREGMNKLWEGFGDLAFSIPDTTVQFEEYPDDYDVVGFPVEPGDALLFDYRILHRSRGNATDTKRVAVSWRWLGDDAVWQYQRGHDPITNPSHTSLVNGERIDDDDAFPVAYTAP